MIELDYDEGILAHLTSPEPYHGFTPARVIPMSRRSMRGTTSVKERRVDFESDLEHDLLVRLDFDPDVEVVYEQPIQLRHRLPRGAWRPYTPDALVRFRDGRIVLMEVKYRTELAKNWLDLRPRFSAATAFCRRALGPRSRFAIQTETRIRRPDLVGIRFLRAFRNFDVDPTIAGEIGRLLDISGPRAASEIAETIGQEALAQPILAQIWALCWRSVLKIDLDRPITPATIVRRASA